MKTQEEKDAMITKLGEVKNTLPEFSMFGTENWAVADGQIRVIEEDLDEDGVVEEFGEEFDEDGEQNETVREILIAVSWLEGDVEDSELVDD